MTNASKPPVIDIDGPENEDWIKEVTRRRDAQRSVAGVASAWADAAVSAIAKDKGWAPGPNARWRRTDEAPGESRDRAGAKRGPGTARKPKDDDLTILPSKLAGTERVERQTEFGTEHWLLHHFPYRDEDSPEHWYLERGTLADAVPMGYFYSREDALDRIRGKVTKDKGWAPGPNAQWRRLDEGQTSYRYTHSTSPMSELGHALFADDEERVSGGTYGEYAWAVDSTELTPIEDLDEEIRAAFREEVALGDDSDLPRDARELSEDDFVATFNPDDIVNSAAAYDSSDLQGWLYWRVIEPKGIKGVKTSDGAIVWDQEIIKPRSAP